MQESTYVANPAHAERVPPPVTRETEEMVIAEDGYGWPPAGSSEGTPRRGADGVGHGRAQRLLLAFGRWLAAKVS